MKILIVAMRSLHATRWVSQLKESGHEVFYFDILNGGYIKEWDWVIQHTNWRYKFGNFKGRYFVKKYFPKMHKLFENNVEKEFENVLNKVKPDVVHSFVMYISCSPIFKVMRKNNHIKWIYSVWGNDLYFNKNIPKYKKEIDKVLPNIDYLFADCKRDLLLAKELGFKGQILGDFPGGGGYHIDMIEEEIKKIHERKYILIKGYHSEKHRGLQVLKAIELINDLPDIIIFSADKIVYDYINSSNKLLSKNIKTYRIEDPINHIDFCKMMNRSLIYIGNNLSDGLPNTLLEAICFGAFPIQSNPGGASAEIIADGMNGILINDCEDVAEIKLKIEKTLADKELLLSAFEMNMKLRQKLEFNFIRDKVLEKYNSIENDLKKM